MLLIRRFYVRIRTEKYATTFFMVATKSSALQMPILLESKVILCQIDEVRRFYLCNFLFVGDERYRRTQTKKKETYIKFNTQFMCAKTIMRREDIKLNNGENVRV